VFNKGPVIPFVEPKNYTCEDRNVKMLSELGKALREAEKDISQKKRALDEEKKSNPLEQAKKAQRVKEKSEKERTKNAKVVEQTKKRDARYYDLKQQAHDRVLMALSGRNISTRIDLVTSENADELARKIIVLKDQKKAATVLILEAHLAMLKHV